MKKLVAILRGELYWKVLYFIGNQYFIALIIRLIFGITLKCKFKMLVSLVRNFIGKLPLVCILLLSVINVNIMFIVILNSGIIFEWKI